MQTTKHLWKKIKKSIHAVIELNPVVSKYDPNIYVQQSNAII